MKEVVSFEGRNGVGRFLKMRGGGNGGGTVQLFQEEGLWVGEKPSRSLKWSSGIITKLRVLWALGPVISE